MCITGSKGHRMAMALQESSHKIDGRDAGQIQGKPMHLVHEPLQLQRQRHVMPTNKGMVLDPNTEMRQHFWGAIWIPIPKILSDAFEVLGDRIHDESKNLIMPPTDIIKRHTLPLIALERVIEIPRRALGMAYIDQVALAPDSVYIIEINMFRGSATCELLVGSGHRHFVTP